jgi:outer membrane usher protein
LFTNRDGRFGIAGMRPGVWRIEMQGDPALAFLFTVAAGAAAAVQAGDLHPIEEKRP